MFCLVCLRRINRIYHQSTSETEKSQPQGKQIIPEMFTVFLALSNQLMADPRVGISQSASETDD